MLPARFAPQTSTNQGFTVLELLITIVVLAVLGATALPILAKQSQKARGVEAKTNLAVLVRAQKAHYHQFGRFAPTLQQLDVNLVAKHYRYAVTPTATGMIKHQAHNMPGSQQTLKEYVAGVALKQNQFKQLICESQHPRNHAKYSPPNIAAQPQRMRCIDSIPLG